MKKLLLVFFVLLTASATAREPKKSENVITLTTALIGMLDNEYIQPVEISYMRSHNQRLYWGASMTAAFGLRSGGGCSDSPSGNRYRYTENLYKLSAVVCYDLRLVKWWYLRVGAGVGIGMNRTFGGEHQAGPYFDVQLNWLLKFKKVDILLSPLLVIPSSKVSFSSASGRSGTLIFGPSIGVGVKF